MFTLSIITLALVLADSGSDPAVIIGIIVVSLLILWVIAWIIIPPEKEPKKQYCPYCGRGVNYPSSRKDKEFRCPHCKQSL